MWCALKEIEYYLFTSTNKYDTLFLAMITTIMGQDYIFVQLGPSSSVWCGGKYSHVQYIVYGYRKIKYPLSKLSSYCIQ